MLLFPHFNIQGIVCTEPSEYQPVSASAAFIQQKLVSGPDF